MTNKCLIENCPSKVCAKGLCAKHYMRKHRENNVDKLGSLRAAWGRFWWCPECYKRQPVTTIRKLDILVVGCSVCRGVLGTAWRDRYETSHR